MLVYYKAFEGSTLQVSYSLMLAVSKRYVVLHPPYMPGGLYQHCHLQNDLVQVYVEELLNEEEEKEIKCKSESTSIVDVEQPGSCRYFFQIPHGFEATSQEKVSLQRIVTCGRKRKREVLKTEELKEVDEEKDNEISGRNDKHVELYPNSASFDSHLKYSPQSSMNYAKSDPVNQLEDVELKTHNLSSDLENSKKKDISHEAVMKEALDYHVCERFSESSKTAVSAENNLQLDGDIEKTCNKATSKIVRAKLKEGAENFMITNDSQLASETASRLNSNIGLASKRCKKNQSTSVKGRNRIARKRSQNCDWFYSELHSSDSDKETSVGKSKIQPRGKLSLKRKR
ncbi:uncharacterized protein LOC106465236 isoform X2 [Limulus polyphemus]|uniref:Uncharacterized protein LOC106465236 isoform X2 n=1 Tax=Limulus polyphemus TaxID=6850 RepID=A0ABM1BFE9_LIMPO|nr:uncharacterized protein LOC106465236 isoform X2 [Limulus polyphemus]